MTTLPNHPANAPIWGFTLIELLVVIAIISVLAAMLLPAWPAQKQPPSGRTINDTAPVSISNPYW